MAAAFAALVSNHPLHSFSFEDEQIEALGESVGFLIDFMESYDNSHGARKEAANALEWGIARAAQAAEDVIESHVVDQIRSGKTRSKTRPSRFLLDLQNMDYMRRKASNVKSQSGMEAEQQPTATPLTSNKTSMVGFDDLLLQFLDKLTGDSSSRQAIPIVGMGGIDKTTLARNVKSQSSWDLFCKKAFVEQDFPPELEEIGKKIVEKCKGLAISESPLEYWENVAQHIYELNFGF